MIDDDRAAELERAAVQRGDLPGPRPVAHRCAAKSCGMFGLKTDKSCLCHKSELTMLREQRNALLEALARAAALIHDAEKDTNWISAAWHEESAAVEFERLIERFKASDAA